MATYTAVAGGGNWNSTATWGGSGYPVAGDTAQITSAMTGTVTVNVASACAVLNMTGNGGTLAFGTQVLTVSAGTTLSGTITATSGNNLTITGGGVTLAGNCGSSTTTINLTTIGQTLTSGGFTWGGKINFNYAGTFVLNGNWINSGSWIVTLALVLNWTTNETFTFTGGCALSGAVSGTAKIVIGGTGNSIGGSSSTVSSNVDINCTSCTFAGNFSYSTKTLSWIAGTVTASAGTLVLPGSCTLVAISNINWLNITIMTASCTVTSNSTLTCSGIFKAAYPGMVVTGCNVTCGTFLVDYYQGSPSFTMDAGKTLTSGKIQISGCFADTYTMTIKSGTGSSPMYINYTGTPANCQVSRTIFTDVDASSGNQIFNYFGSTLTRCNNATFTVSAANATVGATYTNNGQTFTVDATIAGATTLKTTMPTSLRPTASGTLTKASGTGDATITFSAVAVAGIINMTTADFATTSQAGNIQSGTTISGIAGTLSGGTSSDVFGII